MSFSVDKDAQTKSSLRRMPELISGSLTEHIPKIGCVFSDVLRIFQIWICLSSVTIWAQIATYTIFLTRKGTKLFIFFWGPYLSVS
jgi:hypothetical protein